MIDFQPGDLIYIPALKHDRFGACWREPPGQPMEVAKMLRNRRTGAVKVQLKDGTILEERLDAWQHYPQKGDRVIVTTGTYTRWYWRTVETFPWSRTPKGYKQYSNDEDREWMERYSPDEFPYGIVFDLRWAQDNGMCVVRGEGQEFTVAIVCLEVLERVRNGAKQPVKSIA